MNQQYQIGLVVFDWAGTTVDYGSSAPSEVFDRVFTAAGIRLSREEINRPMGMEKKAHIRQVRRLEKARARDGGPGRCPWCGGALVLRTARRGSQAGRQFYGCIHYPDCTYTQEL